MTDLGKTQLLAGQAAKESIAILRDIGRSLRRVKSKDTRDKDGLRVVWHQGKLRSDLSSWENEAQDIHRQEFCFFNQMIEFRKGHALRTGAIPQNTTEDMQFAPKSELFVPHRMVQMSVLEAASSILRACSKRDYFTQHLLKEVNRALNDSQKMAKRTQVLGLEIYQALDQAIDKARAEAESKKADHSTLYVAASIVVGAMIVATLLFYILRR